MIVANHIPKDLMKAWKKLTPKKKKYKIKTIMEEHWRIKNAS